MTALAALAALGTMAACTPGGSASGAAPDGKSVPLDGSSVSPMPPGKYQTLPQPCIAVDLDLLKQLVPGVADYAGREALTYDTDRRVGCGWRGATSDGTTRTLKVDFERVVSYDPGVSDEVQAETDFDQQAAAASIPLSPTTTPPATVTTAPPTTSPAGGDGTDLAPRRLTDVGNAAFINDVRTARPGAVRRDITLVFRTANVVVSVVYSQASPRDTLPPQSADLQKGAQQVAAQLERKVES